MNQAQQAQNAMRRMAARRTGGNRYSLWNKYFSTVCFNFAVTGTFTYTVAAGTEYRAFSYAIGQDMATVGFPASTPATMADTNMHKSGETISGETVEVYGLSALLTSDSDAQLAKVAWPLLSVTLSLNGDTSTFKLGTPEFIPQAGGLCGHGDSYVQAPGPLETLASTGVLTNGIPQVSNFFPFPDPVVWQPSGNADSSLIIKVKAERAITYTTALAADRVAVAGGATSPGTAPWTHPTGTAIGTNVKIKFHLHSRQDGPRSQMV